MSKNFCVMCGAPRRPSLVLCERDYEWYVTDVLIREFLPLQPDEADYNIWIFPLTPPK